MRRVHYLIESLEVLFQYRFHQATVFQKHFEKNENTNNDEGTSKSRERERERMIGK
jgi:hypothetical protein